MGEAARLETDDATPKSSHHNCRRSRDLEIIVYLAQGYSRQEIAGLLYMSQANVAYRIHLMRSRAQVQNSAALVARAYSLGLLDQTTWPPTAGNRCLCQLPRNSATVCDPMKTTTTITLKTKLE